MVPKPSPLEFSLTRPAISQNSIAVRCFDDPNVVHVDGSVDPLRDIETINLELIFSDIEILERRILKSSKAAKDDKSIAAEVELLKEILAGLEENKSVRTMDLTDDQREFVETLNLQLTTSPSCITYSLPSSLTLPFSLALAIEPHSTKSL